MSTAATPKPAKPYADFPLFPHASGRWAKKIRGKLVYFGPWRDADGALAKYLDQRDDLQAGRKPRPKKDGFTVRGLLNSFLRSKRHLLDTQEITRRTWGDYNGTCDNICADIGLDRLVADLDADDFADLRKMLARKRGPVALGNEIQRVRSVFKFAYDNQLIDAPVRFGSQFRKPNRKAVRAARHAVGKRMFEADELRRIIDAAPMPLRAMILLGANAGFGQTDIAALPTSALDLKRGWLEFPRPKTAVPRRVPLWPETSAAITDAINTRPKPHDSSDGRLVFLTRFGRPWVRVNKDGMPTDKVGDEFNKLLRRLDLKRDRVSFYALRHGFETVAGESRDQVAVDAIMGHVDESMAGRYREGISDERLRAVVNHVRGWLFGEGAHV